VTFALAAAAAAGTLDVHVSPRDAAVTVDGEVLGVGPTTATVPDGAHRVRVTADAFQPWEQVVEVKASTCVAVTLARVPSTWEPGREAAETYDDVAETVGAVAGLLAPRVVRDAPPPRVVYPPAEPPTAGPPPWEVAEPCPATAPPAAPPPPPSPP
jgi:hypothetical protein